MSFTPFCFRLGAKILRRSRRRRGFICNRETRERVQTNEEKSKRRHASPRFGDIYSVQLSVTPTDDRTCVTDTCSIFTEDPFPLCFSRTTSNNKQLLPTAGLCFRAPPLLLLWGFPLSVLPHRPSPLAVLASRLVPAFMHTPDRCLSRSRHALLLSYFTVLALCFLRGLHYRHPLNASLPFVFQVFAPKSSLG